MNVSLPTSELKQYISRQLENFFPDKYHFDGTDVDIALNTALQRTEYCFKHISLPHYTREGQVWFDHLHSDQYSAFLYFLSNSLWKQSENKPLCDKLVLLNKALNALFVTYKCNMPDIFLFSHPVGTVIGNAVFSDFLLVLQNVTISTSDSSGFTPQIGKGVVLSAGCVILGSTKIGNRCSIGANVVSHNLTIPDDSIVFTNTNGILITKQRDKECFAQRFFKARIID